MTTVERLRELWRWRWNLIGTPALRAVAEAERGENRG